MTRRLRSEGNEQTRRWQGDRNEGDHLLEALMGDHGRSWEIVEYHQEIVGDRWKSWEVGGHLLEAP